jgi:hypothetical protein
LKADDWPLNKRLPPAIPQVTMVRMDLSHRRAPEVPGWAKESTAKNTAAGTVEDRDPGIATAADGEIIDTSSRPA